MTEQEQQGHDERTGDPRVDAVLDDTRDLEEREVREQVAAFEDAHDRLRAALDDPEAAERPESGRPTPGAS